MICYYYKELASVASVAARRLLLLRRVPRRDVLGSTGAHVRVRECRCVQGSNLVERGVLPRGLPQSLWPQTRVWCPVPREAVLCTSPCAYWPAACEKTAAHEVFADIDIDLYGKVELKQSIE